jgi:hypothetical protein
MVYSVYFVKCENKIEGLLGLVWATFWIIFQLVFLAGFATLGIYAFKVAITIPYLSWIKLNWDGIS